MKRLLFLLLFVCGITGTIYAQTAKENKIINKINNIASQMKTMQCDFIQTKYLKMLNDKMVSRGKMYYQKSNKLHWEYTSPYTYTFILNDSKVLLKKGKRNDVIDINQNKMFQQIARIMMNSVVGKCLSDKKDFKVRITEGNTEWIAYLTPQKKTMKQMFQRIVLHFNKRHSTVSRVDLVERNGDKTVISLVNIKLNRPVYASAFYIN
nr:outer membrane lipoprotein carrier protein LolA [Prevotella sp.]